MSADVFCSACEWVPCVCPGRRTPGIDIRLSVDEVRCLLTSLEMTTRPTDRYPELWHRLMDAPVNA